MDYLLFRLYGPMASWGEIAVGETRHSASYPSKSAIIGLMASALGIRRDETEKQMQMQDGYAVAIEVSSQGALLRDFHTTQVPDSVGKFIYRTRRDELVYGKERLGTILSSREYRSDALALVAVKGLPSAPYALGTIKKHLLEPVFHLYLGRRSCPLAAPMHPLVIEGNNFFEAFQGYQHKGLMPFHDAENNWSKRDTYWLGLGKERHYYWEGETADFSDTLDMSRMQTRVRHDQPLSRWRWQFAPRHEHYFYYSGGE
ncbi:MAG: type I-E CRISPR-associated protein Cas5/CasD [Desulfobulbaceae bacterium]|nr:type I-E CRISPR-associated protein Cas5/CasD [Desulfobulbaceae bacterium]